MKKHLFLLLALLVLCAVPLVGCGNQTENGDDVPSDSVSSGTEDFGDVSSSEASDSAAKVFDEALEHRVIVTDIRNAGLVVLDLNECTEWTDLTMKHAVVWEWRAETSKGCTIGKDTIRAGIDDAKFRWSEYYKKDVVIATASSGWAGVIDYETGDTLWETSLGNCPHSIEMLPNGDLVVAGSGGDTASAGELVYFPLSTGKRDRSSVLRVKSCHGVCWDPDYNQLWILYFDGVMAATVNGYGTANAKLAKLNGVGALFENDAAGHDFSPVFGSTTKYWVTAGQHVYQFDTENNELTTKYTGSQKINSSGVKGIAAFSDGTMVQTVSGQGGNTAYDWSTLQLRVLVFQESQGKIKTVQLNKTDVTFSDREFYKVHTFTKDYQ